jgi:hypothetical protein
MRQSPDCPLVIFSSTPLPLPFIALHRTALPLVIIGLLYILLFLVALHAAFIVFNIYSIVLCLQTPSPCV